MLADARATAVSVRPDTADAIVAEARQLADAQSRSEAPAAPGAVEKADAL